MPHAKPLTDRQRAMLDYIERHIREKQRPPTIRDIRDACGISSTSVVEHHLKRMEVAGYLHRDEGKSNGIRLVKPVTVAPDPALLNLVDLLRDVRDYLEDHTGFGDADAEALLARFSTDLTAPQLEAA